MKRISRSAYFPALIILFIYVLISFLWAYHYQFNFSGFAYIGDYFSAPLTLQENAIVNKNAVGNDGQWYYYMSFDPLMLNNNYDFFDIPAYRYQRILFPLIVWTASFGSKAVIPLMMVIINIIAIAAGTAYLSKIAVYYKQSKWNGFYYALLPGIMFSVLFDLAEPLAMCLLAGAVLFYLNKKITGTAIYLSLAVLCRETYILAVFGFVVYHILSNINNKEKAGRIFLFMIPAAVFVIWQFYIYTKFGTFGVLSGKGTLDLPFKGIYESFANTFSNFFINFKYTIFDLPYLIFVIIIAVFVINNIIKRRSLASFLSLLFLLLAVLLSHKTWLDRIAFSRLTLELNFFFLLVCLEEKQKIVNYIFIIPVFCSLLIIGKVLFALM